MWEILDSDESLCCNEKAPPFEKERLVWLGAVGLEPTLRQDAVLKTAASTVPPRHHKEALWPNRQSASSYRQFVVCSQEPFARTCGENRAGHYNLEKTTRDSVVKRSGRWLPKSRPRTRLRRIR